MATILVVASINWKAEISNLSDQELDEVALLISIRRRQRSMAHRLELTRTLDDRDDRNWMEPEDAIDNLAVAGAEPEDFKQLVAFLVSLGENENLRGTFVEKDNKDRNIEVSVVGRYAVYFHLEAGSDVVRILRIVPT